MNRKTPSPLHLLTNILHKSEMYVLCALVNTVLKSSCLVSLMNLFHQQQNFCPASVGIFFMYTFQMCFYIILYKCLICLLCFNIQLLPLSLYVLVFSKNLFHSYQWLFATCLVVWVIQALVFRWCGQCWVTLFLLWVKVAQFVRNLF